MIVTDNIYSYAGAGLGGQSSAAGKSGRYGRGGESDFWNNISGASQRIAQESQEDKAETAGNEGNISAQEEFSKHQGTISELIRKTSQDEKQLSREELLQLLADHREEILKKIKNGDTGVKIPIGSMYLTQEEWEKLLESFDEAQEKIQEEVREESGEVLREKRPDTTINGDRVFAQEDTGHDLKSLEELVGETNIEGKSADDFDEQNLLTDEEDERQV